MKYLLLTFTILTYAQVEPPLVYTCHGVGSPLFFNTQPLKILLTTNFKLLNENVISRNTQPYVMSYTDPSSKTYGQVNGLIHPRGNSRSDLCGWTPFKLLFDERNNFSKNLIKSLPKDKEMQLIDHHRHYSNYVLSSLSPKTTTSLNTPLFSNLSRPLSVITHCEKNSLLGKNVKTSRDIKKSVLYEHALHSILNSLKLPVIRTRLTEMTYFDTSDFSIKKEYALLRESRTDLAKRCSFTKSKKKFNLPPYNNASIIFQFLQYFVGNYDHKAGSHNSKNLLTPDNTDYFSPYDFDLSWIIVKDRFIRNPSNELKSFETIIRKLYNSNVKGEDLRRKLIALILHILKNKRLMIHSIKDIPFHEKERREFESWLNRKFSILENFINTKKTLNSHLILSIKKELNNQ